MITVDVTCDNSGDYTSIYSGMDVPVVTVSADVPYTSLFGSLGFTDATFAYQGGGRGFDLEVLSTLERWVQQTSVAPGDGIRQPDLTLWFDLATDIAAARLAGTRVPDRFEAQPVAFFEQVRAGYARRMALDPCRFARIDAGQGREAVWASVCAAIPSGYLTS